MRAHKTLILKIGRVVYMFLLLCVLTFSCATPLYAAPDTDEIEGSTVLDPQGDFRLDLNSNGDSTSLSASLQMMLVLTVLSIAPSILIMLTSFTRIIIVLHFARSALGTQTTPPNQVLIGLALFMTFSIMSPVISEVNTKALQPFQAGEISQEEAINKALVPLRGFMDKQTKRRDIDLFMDISKNDTEIKKLEDIPISVLIPAFIVSELRAAFIMGFLLYLPFIVLDMVIASTLMSMGMMMLPPTTISMPFKILLFILADGWNLVIGSVAKTFS